MKPRCVAIITGPDTYLDHMVPICFLMNMPLIVTEKSTYRTAKLFYPQVEVLYKELQELSLEYLAGHFDAIFESGKFWAAQLKSFLSLVHGKQMRFVFCPHGNSDKGHSLRQHVEQDINLVYADHMIDLLQQTRAVDHIRKMITVGNYRWLFYTEHKEFYDSLAKDRLHIHNHKKTILYAPTWQDGENPSSFFSSTEHIIGELSDEYNVIIKLHPFLEEFHPAHTYHVLSKYEHSTKVLFLQNFPSIYPLLQRCDVYVGDYSSIGYDFLTFDRPLYFLPGVNKSFSLLHRCGLEIPDATSMRSYLTQTLADNQHKKQEARKELYKYAFGTERSFESIRKDLLRAIE